MNPLLIGLATAGIYLYTSKKSTKNFKIEVLYKPGYNITNCNTIRIHNSEYAFDYAFSIGKSFIDNDDLMKFLFEDCKGKLKVNSSNIKNMYSLLFVAYAGAYYNKKLKYEDITNKLEEFINKYKKLGLNLDINITLDEIKSIIDLYSGQ